MIAVLLDKMRDTLRATSRGWSFEGERSFKFDVIKYLSESVFDEDGGG